MGFRWRTLLIFLMVAGMSLATRHFHPDDALIYARYVRNLLSGVGLVFNPGERVNALTSPLHTALLAGSAWLLRGQVLLAEWLLGVIFMALTAILAEWFLPCAGILIAGCLYFYIFLGMETPLFLFLLVLCAVLYVRDRWQWLPLALCLVTLTRFEGGAFAIPVAWQMWKQKRWPRWQWWLPAIAIMALYFVLNLHYYGKWFPSSGMAKLIQGYSGAWGKWPKAFYHLPRAFWYPLRSFLYAVLLALWLSWRGAHDARLARWNQVVLPFLAILLSFYTLLNVPGYLWYYAPFVMFALVYSSVGLPRKRWVYSLVALVLLHSTLLGGYLGVHIPAMYEKYRYICRWINTNAAPGATVASAETGTIGWYSPEHPVIDIVGLTTPRNAQLMAHHDQLTWLEEEKPDYVVMHTGGAWGEPAALHSPNYERLPVAMADVYLMRRKTQH
jgi:arabinofuranosyltransferase